MGAITNADYRGINNVDTLTASSSLRKLRDLDLLHMKGQGNKTYYIPTEKLSFGTSDIMKTNLSYFTEASKQVESNLTSDEVAGQVTGQAKILEFCKQPRTAKEIMKLLKLKHRESFYKNYFSPLLQQRLLLMTIPDKPKSRSQKYFTYTRTGVS